mgnify:FL=1
MKHATRLICCVALCSVVSSVALAERRERPERVPSTGIMSPVYGAAVSLTVSGEGYWKQYLYEEGEQPPSVGSLYGSGTLPDGHYRYEFVAVQDVPVAADAGPESAVFVAAGDAKQPPQIVSGTFTMDSGAVTFN